MFKIINKTFITYLVASLLLVFLFISYSVTASPAHAQSSQEANIAEMQEKIKSLLAMIQQLTTLLEQRQGIVTPQPGVSPQNCIAERGVILTIGSRGNEITQLQRFLAQDPSIYPDGEISGYYGQLTRAAVQRFQTRHGITTVNGPGYGNVGPRTRAALYKECQDVVTPNTPPTISSITPTSGPVGTTITIKGTGFTLTGNTLRFGDYHIHHLQSNNGKITVSLDFDIHCPSDLPSDMVCDTLYIAPGQYNVSVINADKQESESVRFEVATLDGVDSIASLKIDSPQKGEVYEFGDPVLMAWELSGISSYSIALYKDDKWQYWIMKDVDVEAVDNSSKTRTFGVYWDYTKDEPHKSRMAEISDAIGDGKNLKIYITARLANGQGYLDTKSDAFTIKPKPTIIDPIRPYITYYSNDKRLVEPGDTITIHGSNFNSRSSYIKVISGIYDDGGLVTKLRPRSVSDSRIQFTLPKGMGYADVVWISVVNPGIRDMESNEININLTLGDSIEEGITVTSPNGGEVWYTGRTNTIKWAPYHYNPNINPAKDVTAYLDREIRGRFVEVGKILDNGKASLHTHLEINERGNLADPGEYYVRVVNERTGEWDRSDKPFMIKDGQESPKITSITPTKGSVGSTITIRGEGFSPEGNAIKFGNGYIIAVPSSPVGSTLHFRLPGRLTKCSPLMQARHSKCGVDLWDVVPARYDVSVINSAGKISNTVSYGVIADTRDITVTSPNGGETWHTGQTNTVTWSPYDSSSGANPVADVTVYLEQKNGSRYDTVGKILDSGKASMHTLLEVDRRGNYPPSGEYYVRVVNNRTGASDRSDRPFTIVNKQQEPLRLTSITPHIGFFGTRITIKGAGFSNSGNYVNFDGAYLGGLSSSDGETISFSLPEAMGTCSPKLPDNLNCTAIARQITPGGYNVSVINADKQESESVRFVVLAPVDLSGVTNESALSPAQEASLVSGSVSDDLTTATQRQIIEILTKVLALQKQLP